MISSLQQQQQQQQEEQRRLIRLEDVEVKQWSQRETLRPPPYDGAFQRLTKGLNIGDPHVDALPGFRVCSHGEKAQEIEQLPEPEWVDWRLVRKGQEIWMDNLGRLSIVGAIGLIQGFSIARFAEVLFASGYAQSARTAFLRYSQTGFFILDWLKFPLDDPKGISRQAIYNVRAMHSFARRRALEKHIMDPEQGEGIPLSQYDMAEVQLGFCTVSLYILEHEIGSKTFNKEEKEALIHVWRYIGYHLGIMDEFNVCNSVEENEELFKDWMKWTPHRLATCRECTFELQRTAVEGFGQFTGLGEEFWVGVLHRSTRTRNWDINTLRLRKPMMGMTTLAGVTMAIVGSDTINRIVTWIALHAREDYRLYPDYMKKAEQVLRVGSKVQDLVTWRILGMLVLCLETLAGYPQMTLYAFVSGMTLLLLKRLGGLLPKLLPLIQNHQALRTSS